MQDYALVPKVQVDSMHGIRVFSLISAESQRFRSIRACKVIACMQCFGLMLCLVNTHVNWAEYLAIISEGATGSDIARQTGVPESTISRWLSSTSAPRPNQVVRVARAYGLNPLTALVAAGYVDESDVDLTAMSPRALQLREFTELELAREMVRRVELGGSDILESPLDGDHPAMTKSNVTRLPHAVPTEEEALDLGAVAHTGVKEVAEFDDESDEHDV